MAPRKPTAVKSTKKASESTEKPEGSAPTGVTKKSKGSKKKDVNQKDSEQPQKVRRSARTNKSQAVSEASATPRDSPEIPPQHGQPDISESEQIPPQEIEQNEVNDSEQAAQEQASQTDDIPQIPQGMNLHQFVSGTMARGGDTGWMGLGFGDPASDDDDGDFGGLGRLSAFSGLGGPGASPTPTNTRGIPSIRAPPAVTKPIRAGILHQPTQKPSSRDGSSKTKTPLYITENVDTAAGMMEEDVQTPEGAARHLEEVRQRKAEEKRRVQQEAEAEAQRKRQAAKDQKEHDARVAQAEAEVDAEAESDEGTESDSPPVASTKKSAPVTPKKKGKGHTSKSKKTPQASKLLDTEKNAERLKKNPHPESVLILESNVQTSGPILAGYLHLKDTDALQSALDEVEDIFDTLARMQREGYKIPDIGPKFQVQAKGLFGVIRDQAESVKSIEQIEDLSYNDPCFSEWKKNDKVFVNALYVGMIYLTLDALESSGILKNIPDKYRGKAYGNYRYEDCYRAYCMWRYYSNNAKKSKSLVSGQPAPTVRYFDQDQPRNQGPDQTVVYREPAELDFVQTFYEDLAVGPDLAPGNDPADTSDAAPQGGDNQDHDSSAEDADADPMAAVENDIQRVYVSKLTGDDIKKAVKGDRALLPMHLVRQFLHAQSKLVKVRHDDWTMVNDPGITAKAAELANSAGETVEPHSVRTISLKDASKEFWDLRKSLASVSDDSITFEQACRRLKFDSSPEMMNEPQIKDSAFVPTAWQIIFAAWVRQRESSFVRGGINADDCGIGKTLGALLAVYSQAVHVRELESQGKPFDARPTLVVCPGAIVEVWYQDWSRWMRKVLTFRQYYGTSDSYKDTDRLNTLLPTSAEKAAEEIRQLYPRNKASSAAVIIVTSYKKFASQCLITRPTKDEHTEVMKSEEEYQSEYINLQNTSDFKVYANDQADSNDCAIDDRTNTYSNTFKHLFKRAFCDEGHALKNTRTLNHRAVATAYPKYVYWLSATPMINRASDLVGYLSLTWDKRWAIKLHSKTPEGYYDDDFEFEPESPGVTAQQYLEELEGQRMYWLDPKIFCNFVNKNLFNGALARKALGGILGLIQLRRTMASKIEAWGKTITIRDRIPHYMCTTVELEYDQHEQRMFDRVWDVHGPFLARPNLKVAKPNQIQEKGLRNMAIHRHVSLSTFDLRMTAFLERLKGGTSAANVMEWYTKYNDGGATFYHQWSRFDPKEMTPADRWSMAHFVCSYNPKMRYLCRLLEEALYSADPYMRGKLLVFVRWPLEQWVVGILLTTLDIPFLVSRSGLTAEEKSSVHTRFNDPKDEHLVLIASSATGSLGINLQDACHKICIMSFPDNINTYIQMIGRIHRYGQRYIQYVWNLSVDHSYDQIVITKAIHKFMTQVVGEAKLTNMSQETINEIRQKAEKENLTDLEIGILVAQAADLSLELQADTLIMRLLGLRCSRRDWNNPDLYKKDQESDKVPGRIRQEAGLVPMGEYPDWHEKLDEQWRSDTRVSYYPGHEATQEMVMNEASDAPDDGNGVTGWVDPVTLSEVTGKSLAECIAVTNKANNGPRPEWARPLPPGYSTGDIDMPDAPSAGDVNMPDAQ